MCFVGWLVSLAHALEFPAYNKIYILRKIYNTFRLYGAFNENLIHKIYHRDFVTKQNEINVCKRANSKTHFGKWNKLVEAQKPRSVKFKFYLIIRKFVYFCLSRLLLRYVRKW